MEQITTCPTCHIQVRPTDYFCFNCGKNLRPAPIVLSFTNLFMLFAGTLILPPIGMVWGLRYVRDANQAAKIMGWLAIVITIVELVLITLLTINIVNTVNEQVNSQMQNILGL